MGVNQSRSNLTNISDCIRLIDRNPQDFSLSQQAINFLETLQGECYIISISGRCGTGKSTLFNLLLSLFAQDTTTNDRLSYRNIYPIGDGYTPTTEHINMCCVTINNKNFILLDVEGSDGFNRGKDGNWVDGSLLRLVAGASHIHIYNFSHNLGRQVLADFKFINQLLKSEGLEPQINTKYVLLKRNCCFDDEDALKRDLHEFEEKKPAKASKLNPLVYMLNKPPNHLMNIGTPCLNEGFVCQSCQKHLFMKIITNLWKDLQDQLTKTTSFQNGAEVLSRIESLLNINRRDFPYFTGSSDSQTVVLAQAKKNQIKILAELAKIKPSVNMSFITQSVAEICEDKPYMKEIYGNFMNVWSDIQTKLATVEYFLAKLEKFLNRSLFNNKYAIYSEAHKDCLLETYVNTFEELTDSILEDFSLYKDVLSYAIVEATNEIYDDQESCASGSLCSNTGFSGKRRKRTRLENLQKVNKVVDDICDEEASVNMGLIRLLKEVINRNYEVSSAGELFFIEEVDKIVLRGGLVLARKNLEIYRKPL